MSKQTLKPGKRPNVSAKDQPRYVQLWERIRTLEEKLNVQEAQNNLILRENIASSFASVRKVDR